MAEQIEFYEEPRRRRRRLLIALLGIPGTLIIGALMYWLHLDDVHMNPVVVGLIYVTGFLILAVWEIVAAARTPKRLATVGDKGIGLQLPDKSWHEFEWSEIRSFELPSHPGQPKDHAFVNVNAGGRPSGSLRLPLQLLGPDLFDDFTNALRRYWPDIDETWQVQLRNRGLDSSAP